jgi:uncharacterized protein (TIGR02246 family)
VTARLAIGGLLLSLVSAAAAATLAARPLQARIDQLEDQEQIRQLLTDYARHLDARDLKAYSALFAADGEWVGGFGSAKGPANIQAFMEKSLGAGPNRDGSYHVMSYFTITVNGDQATAFSRWTYVVPRENNTATLQGSHYDDTFIRENGVWKFQRRVASSDTPAPAVSGPAPVRP